MAQVVTDKRRFNLPPIFLPLSHAKKHAPLASPALPLARAIYKPVQLTNPAEKRPGKKKKVIIFLPYSVMEGVGQRGSGEAG